MINPLRDQILAANPRACMMLGYSLAELLRTPISAIHAAEMSRFVAFVESVAGGRSGWTDALTCRTKAGDSLPVEISAAAATYAGTRVIVTIVRDVSKLRAAVEALQQANNDLVLAYDRTLQGWSRAMDLRDKETEGHTRRVTELTVRLARTLGVSEEELVHVRRGALLHDIGKLGIPDGILLKSGPLTEEEWGVMRRHPAYAYEFLSPIAYLQPALDVPYCHHEKWDGTGYPRGLKGEEIPLAARVFAVVDVRDALRSDRPYRPAWSEERARAYIVEGAGKDFDPRVVEAFLRLIDAAPFLPQQNFVTPDR